VVCATAAPAPVIEAGPLAAAARGRPLAVVDLAVPRNVEAPQEAPRGLRLTDLSALSRRLRGAGARRRAAVAKAEAVVEEELQRWWRWVESRTAPGVHWRSCRRGSAAG
jgi:glutamyl-tRNA reductase